jgi:cytidylyltransferase-like protein
VKALANDQEQLCDESGIAKVRHQIGLRGCSGKELAFVILSGSFNPVHTQHIRALDLTRKYVESLGWAVVGGFLAPSSDAYVQGKLGRKALPLRRRIALCELAIEGLDWVGVCSKGEVSSYMVCRGVRRELEHYCCDVLSGRRLTGIEIMGSDTVVRIFGKILMQNSSKKRESTQRGRVVCCLLRPSLESMAERKQIERVLVPGVADLGIELILAEPTLGESLLEPVSSSAIREIVSRSDWEALRSKEWLHPAVMKDFEMNAL